MNETGRPTRLLVTGAQGQTGTELTRKGRAAGFEIVDFGRDELNIGDHRAVAQAIESNRPDAVINAAAYTAVDRAETEPEIAQTANTDGPGNIADVCADAGIPIFHISTDYVFDGRGTRPYLEDDAIAPQGIYGATKAAGEEAVRRATKQHIILRTSWVFSAHGRNFVKTMLKLTEERSELGVVGDQKGCPTSAGDIASALLDIAAQSLRWREVDFSPWGTYHFCNRGETSWFGFAQAIVEGAAARGGRNIPVRSIATADYPTPARRPAYSVLDNGKINHVFGIIPRPWKDALGEVLDELAQPALRPKGQR